MKGFRELNLHFEPTTYLCTSSTTIIFESTVQTYMHPPWQIQILHAAGNVLFRRRVTTHGDCWDTTSISLVIEISNKFSVFMRSCLEEKY